MTIQAISPTPEQLTLMQEFGQLLASAIDMLATRELGPFAGAIVQHLTEAMLLHNHALMNVSAQKQAEVAAQIAATPSSTVN